MAADRAINMALRVLGIGEVERDFRRVGDAGSKSFAQVEKSANGATREVSEYTARLKLVAAQLKQVAANIPELSKGTPDQIKANRRDFMLTGIQAAKDRFMKDAVSGLDAGTVAAGRFSGALGVASAAGVAAGISFSGMAFAVQQSLAAYSDHEKAISAFSASLALGGNRSTATAAQIRAMAEEIAASTGQTEEAALQAAVALARIPGMTKEGLEAALQSSARLAATLGTDVASVVMERVIPAFQALADRDTAALKNAMDGLSDVLQHTVLSLAAAGKTAEAQKALLDGLTQAAGDGPGGLTSATNMAAGAWTRLKQTFGEEFSGPAVTALSAVTFALDGLRALTESVSGRWIKMIGLLSNPVTLPVGLVELFRGKKPGAAAENPDPYGTGALFSAGAAAVAAAQVKQLEDKYNAKPARSRGGGRARGGRGGSGADPAQREADQARSAADRIAQANDDVVRSWEQRTAEIEAKAGLEGAALKAVEQQQEVEAAVRRINTELIDKEVEARRKAALAAGQQFDAGKATADATAEVQRQQDSVRGLAERYVEASDAIAEFSRRQSEAKAVLEGLKSPMEKINDEIDQAITLLRAHALTTDQFAARMDQLALAMAKANIEADAGKRIWVGFGDDVGRTLTDLVLHGGSALDVLQKLIQLPLERLLYQTVEQPIAKGIDSLLGVNVDKNAAAIKSGLPDAQTVLGASVSIGTLGSSADAAAAALARLTGPSGTFGTGPGLQSTFLANDNGFTDAVARPLADVGSSAAKAGQAMAELIPLTGQFGGALGQAIAMLSSGGGGGGGILGAVLGIAGSALGGGITAAGVARLAPGAAATIATNPALFASGTDNLPIGRPFWVGENGREKMIRQAGGQVSVLSNQQAHRPAEGGGGGITLVQNISVTERVDPRRTANSLARDTQGALARSARKGIA